MDLLDILALLRVEDLRVLEFQLGDFDLMDLVLLLSLYQRALHQLVFLFELFQHLSINPCNLRPVH